MKTHVPRHDQVIQFCQRLCDVLASRYPHYKTPQMENVTPEDEKDDNNIICIPTEERHRPYHIACEHEHSCCVLIALDKFYFNQCWNTWIDYEKFFELALQHDEPAVVEHNNNTNENNENNNQKTLHESDINYESNKEDYDKYAHYNKNFNSLQYAAPTPRWATYRSKEKGFDPNQTRMLGKKARPVAITSGC
ncbi:hypothetical protein AGDE_09908 [Angomonas deanei]|nr:hypothetical protein AGDE_09908 [Angomonas deanei]|eukprot:EPY29703.1 hypothetical protein AGDE_09908 [Angomonas deanei]